MRTKLIEFTNQENETLRGILTLPKGKPESGTIFLQGFEGNCCIKNSKIFADELNQCNAAAFRFDFAGCGLSDGDFAKMTIAKQVEEFLCALKAFKKEINDVPINAVAHSLGACALAYNVCRLKNEIAKIVLLAPALNQQGLLRYWFVQKTMPQKDKTILINWQNYQQYLDENEFLADCRRTDKMTNADYISVEYRENAKDIDFSKAFADCQQKILYIHGKNF